MTEATNEVNDEEIALTAVLIVPETYASIERTVSSLARQSVCKNMELLVMAPPGLPAHLPFLEAGSFGNVCIVPLPDAFSVGQANAVAVQQASAPLVVFCEDHSFPEPGWAEALIEAHKAPHGAKRAVVGPCVLNANPATSVSWANFLIEYGTWTAHERGVELSHLPGHNSCYKRELLLPYKENLGAMLEAESVLQWDLQAKGYSLYLEARARTRHKNFSVWLQSAILRYTGGRSFAAARAETWSAPRRFVFMLASPLIPFVRWQRLLPIWRRCLAQQQIERTGREKNALSWRVLPVMALGLAVDALGEMVGYGFGAGHSRNYLWSIEFDRDRFATK